MSVNAHVPSSACEALVFSVGYVFVGHRVDIFFRQTEICKHLIQEITHAQNQQL